MKDIEQIVKDGAQVHCMWLQPYGTQWAVMIEQKKDGVELKVHVNGERLDYTIDDACGKWARISGGIKEFDGPVLEHIRPASEPTDIGDEIPF